MASPTLTIGPAPKQTNTGVSTQHDIGQLFGHVLNALPGYSTFGANITNPNINYSGAQNPPTPSNNYYSPATTGNNTNTAPVAPIDTNAGGGSTTSGIPGVSDAATLSAYDQAIANTQAAQGRLPNQLNSANTSVDASYQNALNQLLLGKNTSQQGYDTSKQQSATDYVNAKNTIGSQAGSTLNSLLRLLGSRGVSGSPLDAARQAVARGATLQRSDVGNTFGANNQSLDTGWNNYLTGYNNEVSSATNQRDLQRQNLEQTNQTNQAGLLQTLAQLTAQRDAATGGTGAGAQPYLDQANSLLDKASNYNVAPITYNTQAYQAPSLASYTTAPNATPQFDQQTAGSDYFSPYLSALLGKKQTAVA